HTVSFRGLLSLTAGALPDINGAVDAWIIDTAEDSDSERSLSGPHNENGNTEALTETTLDYLLENATVPVILSDSSEHSPGSREYTAGLRRMAQRLKRLSGDINLQQAHRAPNLWILAASTGGPAAVKEFFAQLPAELAIAFIYAQHIDTNYATTLIRMISSAGYYPAALAGHGSVLQRDSVTLVTAERRV